MIKQRKSQKLKKTKRQNLLQRDKNQIYRTKISKNKRKLKTLIREKLAKTKKFPKIVKS